MNAPHRHAHRESPLREQAARAPGAAPTIALHDLTIAWRGHPAVHHLNGHFQAGTLNAVVGPNGAGKSTLLATLGGTHREYQGRITRPAPAQVAYLPQASTLDRGVPLAVHELVAMGAWARIGAWRAVGPGERKRVERALLAVGLAGFERRLIGELSAGQLQRVLFARVLVQDAAVILLDEPFNALDARTTADLLGVLVRWRQETRTVIAVLHDLEQVRSHFEHTLLLAREAVAWGPTAEVLRAEHLFKARRMAEAWDEHAPRCAGPAAPAGPTAPASPTDSAERHR